MTEFNPNLISPLALGLNGVKLAKPRLVASRQAIDVLEFCAKANDPFVYAHGLSREFIKDFKSAFIVMDGDINPKNGIGFELWTFSMFEQLHVIKGLRLKPFDGCYCLYDVNVARCRELLDELAMTSKNTREVMQICVNADNPIVFVEVDYWTGLHHTNPYVKCGICEKGKKDILTIFDYVLFQEIFPFGILSFDHNTWDDDKTGDTYFMYYNVDIAKCREILKGDSDVKQTS